MNIDYETFVSQFVKAREERQALPAVIRERGMFATLTMPSMYRADLAEESSDQTSTGSATSSPDPR